MQINATSKQPLPAEDRQTYYDNEQHWSRLALEYMKKKWCASDPEDLVTIGCYDIGTYGGAANDATMH